MQSQLLLQSHHQWRSGHSGSPAILTGVTDSFPYAGLDLNLAQFVSSTFTGSRFFACSFKDGSWTGCQFVGCHFSGCDFERLTVNGCSFINCTFTSGSSGGNSFPSANTNTGAQGWKSFLRNGFSWGSGGRSGAGAAREGGGTPATQGSMAYGNEVAGLAVNASDGQFAGVGAIACAFTQAHWSNCQFSGCQFMGCDFEHWKSEKNSFSSCGFRQSQFYHAQFSACRFKNSQWTGSRHRRTQQSQDGEASGSNGLGRRRQLASSFKQASWADCQFDDCQFTTYDFNRLTASDSLFARCTFHDAEFRYSQFNANRFHHCEWTGRSFDSGRRWHLHDDWQGPENDFDTDGLTPWRIEFTGTPFNNVNALACTFKQAAWSSCQFEECRFAAYDFKRLSVVDTLFTKCRFALGEFQRCQFRAISFKDCYWEHLNFDDGRWDKVEVLDCRGQVIDGDRLTGDDVDFTNSYFEKMYFKNSDLNYSGRGHSIVAHIL